uniref:Uncharacterized protein n=1 Tax=Phaeodactylum tricornutum TaxID=2850 RepID=A0A8J9T5B9_PHATR
MIAKKSEQASDLRLVRKRLAARLRQQRCRARKKAAIVAPVIKPQDESKQSQCPAPKQTQNDSFPRNQRINITRRVGPKNERICHSMYQGPPLPYQHRLTQNQHNVGHDRHHHHGILNHHFADVPRAYHRQNMYYGRAHYETCQHRIAKSYYPSQMNRPRHGVMARHSSMMKHTVPRFQASLASRMPVSSPSMVILPNVSSDDESNKFRKRTKPCFPMPKNPPRDSARKGSVCDKAGTPLATKERAAIEAILSLGSCSNDEQSTNSSNVSDQEMVSSAVGEGFRRPSVVFTSALTNRSTLSSTVPF